MREDLFTTIIRSTRGIGDGILMSPIVETIYSITGEKVNLYLHPDVIPVFINNPFVSILDKYNKFNFSSDYYDLTSAEIQYELTTQPNIVKNKTEIWCDKIGLDYSKPRSPKIYLSQSEVYDGKYFLREIKNNKKKIIALGYASLEPWRNYPFIVELGNLLNKDYSVIAIHHESVTANLKVEKYLIGESLRKVFSVINSCDMVVGPDTSHIHIAGALKIPIYGIFGPTNGEVRLSNYSRDCDKIFPKSFSLCKRQHCWYETCKDIWCLKTLSPREIKAQIDEYFSSSY